MMITLSMRDLVMSLSGSWLNLQLSAVSPQARPVWKNLQGKP